MFLTNLRQLFLRKLKILLNLEIFKFVFLIIGIVNPVGQHALDFGFSTFFVSFIAFIVAKKNKMVFSLLVVIVSLLLFFVSKHLNIYSFIGSVLGILVAFLLEKRKLVKNYALFILIFVFAMNSFIIGANIRNFLRTDLYTFAYNNDQGMFLKTFFGMTQGKGYYESYKTAVSGKFKSSTVPKDIWSWRFPGIFLIWQVLPGKEAVFIYWLFLVLVISFLYFASKLTGIFLGERLGLLSAYISIPYFHFALRDETLLLTEWWSTLLFIVALYLLILKKNILSAFFLSLVVLIRELYILQITFYWLYFFMKKRSLLPLFSIPVIAFLIMFVLHAHFLNSFIDSWQSVFVVRNSSQGILRLQEMFAFASWDYLLFFVKPFYLLFLFALMGSFSLIIKKITREKGTLLILSFSIFPIFSLKFGAGPYHDYWGIFFVPIAIALSPLYILFLKMFSSFQIVKEQ